MDIDRRPLAGRRRVRHREPAVAAQQATVRAAAAAATVGFALVLAFADIAHAQPRAPRPDADADAALQVLQRYVGRWATTVDVRRPVPATVTYTETYEWVLDGRFLRGDSGRKSDGSRDLVMATFDPAVGGYRYWVFSSTGAWFDLGIATWSEETRTMRWSQPLNFTVSYALRCEFPDPDTRRCSSLVKDWKGSVLLDQLAVSVRRSAAAAPAR